MLATVHFWAPGPRDPHSAPTRRFDAWPGGPTEGQVRAPGDSLSPELCVPDVVTSSVHTLLFMNRTGRPICRSRNGGSGGPRQCPQLVRSSQDQRPGWLVVHSLISQAFTWYLLRTYSVPGTVPGSRYTVQRNTDMTSAIFGFFLLFTRAQK